MSLLVKNQIEMFKGNIFTPAANFATPQSPGFNGNQSTDGMLNRDGTLKYSLKENARSHSE